MKYIDPDGREIMGLSSRQYQNSAANAGAYPGGEATGFWNRNGVYVENTIGRFGCLFTAAVNIGNTERRNQQARHGIPSNVNMDLSVSGLAQNSEYFNLFLSRTDVGTDFATGVNEISALLTDMTGKSFDVSRIGDKQKAQNTLLDYSGSSSKSAYFIAKVTTDRGNGHFVGVTGIGSNGELLVHDPYEGGTKASGYNLKDVQAVYVIKPGE